MMPAIHAVALALSSSLAASVVAKATVTTALGLITARLARRSRAAVRYALLAAVFGVLLVLPVASLVSPPVRIALPVETGDGMKSSQFPMSIDAIPAVAPTDGSSTAPWPSRFSPSALWTMGWLAGALLSLLPMIAGLARIRSLRRSGLPWFDGQSVVDGLALETGIRRRVAVLLHEALSAPMTCGVLHPAIVLSPDTPAWQREDLNRAMVHELEHVRRYDYVSHCLARAICAVYWFHPLVWVAWRQLALEAERACDDAVLRRSEATDYADQLVTLARRLSMAAKSPLLAMVNRADLATRVGAVLDIRQRRGRAGMFPVALACAAAAVLVLTLSPLTIVAAPQSASVLPKFDAVSIKLVDPDSGSDHSSEHDDPGRLTMTGSMHRFIVRAYGITDGQLGGEPDWFKTRLYSIVAVTSTPARPDQMMLMLRSILEDRFQLKLRQDFRDLPVYALEVAAGGPKFKELKPGEIPHHEPAPPGVFARSFSSPAELVRSLNNVFGGRLRVDRPVLDRTHLTGNYDMHLRTEMETHADPFGGRSLQFPNLFHDMQSELGLKLVPERAKMPCFIVEHAAAPTPN
jgi:uncharacterized protein (TIGR03435 family)